MKIIVLRTPPVLSSLIRKIMGVRKDAPRKGSRP